MPRFQQSLDTIESSWAWCVENRRTVFGPNVDALKQAFTDTGRECSEVWAMRAAGRRDVAAE